MVLPLSACSAQADLYRLGLSIYTAKRTPSDQRAVSEYEHGKRRIAVVDLPTIAHVLNVPLLYFYEGELESTDLDHALLKEFQRLPSSEVRRTAIEMLRLFSDAIEKQTR